MNNNEVASAIQQLIFVGEAHQRHLEQHEVKLEVLREIMAHQRVMIQTLTETVQTLTKQVEQSLVIRN